METSNTIESRQCERHGHYEAKIAHFAGLKLGGNCPKCQSEREAIDEAYRKRTQAEDERRRIEGLFKRAGIPPRFQNRSFENYVAADEGQKRALRVSQSYADGWKEVCELGTCLIFSGQPGTGKTHLACAIANALLAKGAATLFTTVSDAMRAIKSTYDPSSRTSESEALYAFVEPRLLILDEAGGSKGSEHEMQLMFDIINKRYENKRPTIILTNLDPTALRDHLGERVTDRLREGGGKLVTFTWASHRS